MTRNGSRKQRGKRKEMEEERQTAYRGEEESQADVRGEWKKDFTANSMLKIIHSTGIAEDKYTL